MTPSNCILINVCAKKFTNIIVFKCNNSTSTTTSKIKNAYFEIPEKEPKKYLSVPDIPQYGVSKLAKFKYAKGGGLVGGQKLFDLEIVAEDLPVGLPPMIGAPGPYLPTGVVVDSSGVIYMTSDVKRTILKFTPR